MESYTKNGHKNKLTIKNPRFIDYEVKPILRSDEEKEVVWCRREEQRKLVVKIFSQTFVKNAFYFLWIRVL